MKNQYIRTSDLGTNERRGYRDASAEGDKPWLLSETVKDPLTEYSDKEPMTPARLRVEGPTAVKRDPNDQTITSEGQTGTDTPEAQEEYRKRGMTKIEDDS